MAEVATEATNLIPQILMSDANTLLNDGKFAEAIVEYKKVIEVEPNNFTAYLRIGICESRLNNN